MAKSNKQLKTEAEKLGIELSGDESNADIQEAINIKEEEDNGEDNKKEEDDKKETTKGGYFYHVKVKAYKDGENRVEIGLYHTKNKVERFDKISDTYVERFDGEIPSLELHKIAEKYKVSAYEKGGKKARKDSELLDELVQEL